MYLNFDQTKIVIFLSKSHVRLHSQSQNLYLTKRSFRQIMKQENSQPETDSGFVIKFVHKKSTQKIAELVNDIKEYFKENDVQREESEKGCLDLIDKSPTSLFDVPPSLFDF